MIEPDGYREFNTRRLVIMSAPNGARRMPEDHAGVPVTATALADCARALLEQSVSVLHLHVRDARHRHSLDAALYREALEAVRNAVGDEMILQVTTEAVGRFSRKQQMQVVRELRPEAVSLALRELCPDQAAEAEAAEFFEWVVSNGIWPQYILYSAADVRRFDALRRRGLFADDHPFTMLVLGQYASGREGTLDDLDALLEAADFADIPWAVCCFGNQENAAAVRAAGQGGHVRIGFENNTALADGSTAEDNAALIAQFHRSLPGAVRRPATADEIRNGWLNAG